jgi:hypothetical protein
MKQYVVGVLLSCLVMTQSFAMDGNHFYRAQLLHGLPRKVSSKIKTSLAVRYAEGEGTRSYGPASTRGSLLSVHGAFDLTRLGTNLNDFTSKVATAAKWNPTGGGTFLNRGTITGANDGLFDVDGKFTTANLSLHLQQTLFSGFYLQAYVPFSKLELKDIKLKNRGAATVNGVDMATFISTELPTILQENGIKGGLTAPMKKMGLGDPVISGGWEGSTKRLASMVTDVAGYMQVGISLPAAASRKAHYIFDLPRGNNGHFGFVGRGAAEACFFGLVTLGAQVGSTTFLGATQTVRLKTDKAQSGWIGLTPAQVKEDLGSIWDLGGYVSVDKIIKGLRAMVGYSVTRQEATRYQVRDGDYLKTFIAAQAALNPAVLVSQDDYANSDDRLKPWEMQTLHAAIRMDICKLLNTSFDALLGLEAAIPLGGKRAWHVPLFGGTLGASLTFQF